MSLESVFKLSLIMNMVDNLTGPMSKVSSSADSSVSKLESMNQTLGDLTRTGATMAGIGSQITDAALAPVEATFETRRALGELASLGVKDLGAVEDAARSFSDQWAGTTKSEFITAAYDIKSGIASLTDEGVAQFTSLAALTGKATKSSTEEMGSLFATGYGIYKNYYSDLSDMQFGEMFSAGISESVRAFKTSGSGMAQSIQTLGASATTANVPMEEQLSILGMLQATMGGAEAGTKYKAFLRSAAKGGEALGLSVLDANNQLLSMPEILDQLRGKFGDTMDAAEKMQLQQAFGDTEAVALIDLMYSKTGDLQDNILNLYGAMGQGTTVAEQMAGAMQGTEPERFDRITQRIQNITETIGDSLLPMINDAMDRGEQWGTKIGVWVGNNQDLVRIIMLVALSIGAYLTVGGTLIATTSAFGLIFGRTIGFVKWFYTGIKNLPDALETLQIYGLYAGDGIKKGFSVIQTAGKWAGTGIKNVATGIGGMARTAVGTGVGAVKSLAGGIAGMAGRAASAAATAIPKLVSSVWSFTSALLANPITWVIIGIIALIAVIILLWQNWDAVSAWISSAWSTVCDGIMAGIDWISGGFTSLTTWVGDKIAWFGEAGSRLITTFVNGIKSVASKPVEAVRGIFDNISKLFPHSDAKEGPLSTLTLSGQRTMTTFADGVADEQNAPAREIERGMSRARTALSRDDVPKVKLSSGKAPQSEDEDGDTGSTTAKRVIIQKLLMRVNLKDIKDIQLLLKLLSEIEDFANSTGDDTDDDIDTDPVLA